MISIEPKRQPILYERASSLFGDEQRFWSFFAVVVGVVAVLKGLRMPNAWAATQAQLNYSHGFIKRGLQGAVLELIGVHRYRSISMVFFLELALFMLALVVLTRRARLEERFGSAAILAMFSSSYAVTYLMHLVGYTDIALGLITMIVLAVRSVTARFWLGLVLVPTALLVHESFLFLFMPVVLFSFFLDWMIAIGGTERRRIAVYGCVLCAVALGVTVLTSLRANMTAAEASRFMTEVEARSDFPIRREFFETLSRSLTGNMHAVLEAMHRRWWWQNLGVTIFTILPVMFLLMRYVERLLELAPGARNEGAHRWRLLVTRVAVFAPLGMYFLGWDCARWNVLCLLSGFLVLVLLSRSLPMGQIRFSRVDRNAVILVIALNMASGYGFFDSFNINPYPFFPALKHFLQRAG